MAKGKIIREKIEAHTPEWYAYRLNYVNSTDVGAILGLSPYSVAAKVFNEKIGRIAPWMEGNKHTFLGLYLEEMIAEIWSYYDPQGPEDNYVKNYKDGNRIRTYKKASGYYRNSKYPWLSTSLDFLINKGQKSALGQVLTKDTPLESKTIDAFEMGKWESIPTYYLAQVHVEMLITETDYSEVVLFDSRKNLHIYPVEYIKDFGDKILDITHDFWQRVSQAKELIKSLENERDESKSMDINYQIDQLEPNAGDNTKAYEDFLKEKYRDNYVKDAKEGSMEDWSNAVKYSDVSAEIKRQEDIKQIYRNKLLKSMGKFEYLTFDQDGEISYSPDKSGKRTLRIKLKN